MNSPSLSTQESNQEMDSRLVLFVSALVALTSFCSCKQQEVSLFNGKDLGGWEFFLAETDGPVSEEPTFSVKDGMLHISGKPNGYIRTVEKYADYTLRLEWRWTESRADSGIYSRLQEGDKVWPVGIQLQMRESDFGFFFSGIPLEGVKPDRNYRKPPLCQDDPELPDGEWNDTRIICEGGHITAYVNGVLVNETQCDALEGYIGIQSEGGAMDFRNIRLIPAK